MKKKLFNLTDNEVKGLQKLAAKTGLSMSDILRRAIDEYLERKLDPDERKELRL